MVQNTKKMTWIIIAAIAIFLILKFLPQAGLFSILPEGTCNYNSQGNFLTNIKYSDTEAVLDYDLNPGAWISVDWDNNGILEGYGFQGRTESGTNICENKPIITNTPAGLRVVKYNDPLEYNEVAICSDEGNIAVRFRDTSNGAIVAITSQNNCSNFLIINQNNQTAQNVTNTNQTNSNTNYTTTNQNNQTAQNQNNTESSYCKVASNLNLFGAEDECQGGTYVLIGIGLIILIVLAI